jgi:hypothetical protein
MIHAPENIKESLRYKPRSLFDSKNTLSAASCAAMAKRETGGPEQELSKRLKILRESTQRSGPVFAKWIGIDYPRWNNYERGYALPTPIALILCQKVPGLTFDWLYRGRLEGMTLDLAARLEEAERRLDDAAVSGKSTTA